MGQLSLSILLPTQQSESRNGNSLPRCPKAAERAKKRGDSGSFLTLNSSLSGMDVRPAAWTDRLFPRSSQPGAGWKESWDNRLTLSIPCSKFQRGCAHQEDGVDDTALQLHFLPHWDAFILLTMRCQLELCSSTHRISYCEYDDRSCLCLEGWWYCVVLCFLSAWDNWHCRSPTNSSDSSDSSQCLTLAQ